MKLHPATQFVVLVTLPTILLVVAAATPISCAALSNRCADTDRALVVADEAAGAVADVCDRLDEAERAKCERAREHQAKATDIVAALREAACKPEE